MSDLQKSTFTINYNGKATKFIMEEMLGEEDEKLITQFTKPDGNVEMANLWIKRLARTIKEPSLNDAILKQMSRKQLTLLKTKWLELNEATKDDFLANSGESPSESNTSA